MSQIRWITIAVLIATYACGTRSALAQHKKGQDAARHAAEQAARQRKQQAEAARKAEQERRKQQERAEHERKKRLEAAKKAEQEHKRKQEAAKKAEQEHKRKQEAARKAEQERKKKQEAARGPEHERKLREESERRIAAARKHRADRPVNRNRQSARDRQIAGTLSHVAVSLHRADHDYDWQRHEAVELVRGALHDLNEPEPNTNGAFGGMSQKRSDEILRENIPVLERVKSELSSSGAPAHHRAAHQKIEEAVSKLHAALRIR
jgi:flagellar biosynthesis GTPase FlhF